ncbi:hypothetical protein [Candidatus Nitrospira nitrosa]|uniref:hypothetical protein n=1 Tax=Candidatus Nitrospira nitrosa TaxID=1742972 RepID=UPI000AC49355|nr:hypothetical protein [Candidatus Nitrospira nitrosa]
MILPHQMTSVIFIRLLIPILILGLSHSEILAEEPKPSTLQISVSNRIKQPFLADEKSIRKLRELIEKRGSETCQNKRVLYQAKFSDNTSYETEDLEPILSEMNRGPQTIVYISMKLNSIECSPHYGGPRIELEFSTRAFDEGLAYAISGNSRDWVYLTQADITKHMESMLINYGLPRWAWQVIVSFFTACTAVTVIGLLLYWQYRNSWSKRNPATQPLTFSRFIVHDTYLFSTLLLIGSTTFVVSSIFSDSLIDHLWPPGVFLIGDEIRRYEEITKTRNGILSFLGLSILLPYCYRILRRFLRRNGVRLP